MPVPDYGLLDTAAPYKAAIAPIQGATYVNQLAAQQLENQKANMEMQNALVEQAAYQRGGDIAQNLRTGGLGKQAYEYEAKQSALDSASLERANAKMSFARGLITDATTPDQFKTIMGGTYGDKDIGPLYAGMGMSADKMHQMVDEAAADPEKWKAFLPQAAMGMKAFQEHATAQMNAQAGLMNAARGGKELALREREVIAKEGKLEFEREQYKDKAAALAGDLSPKQIQKLNAEYPAHHASVTLFDRDSNDLIAKLEALRDNPALEGVTGTIESQLPTIKSKSANFETDLEHVRSMAGLKELLTLKSKGGTLGSVSNAEHQLLRDASVNLNLKQDASNFRKNIDNYIRQVRSSQDVIKNTFDETYAYKTARSAPTAAPTSAPRASGGGSQPWQISLQQLHAKRRGAAQ